MNKNLVYWYYKQFQKIYIKLANKKQLTKKQKNLYYILEEFDFYAPIYSKKIKD